MAMHAAHLAGRARGAGDLLMHEVTVAVHAVLLEDPARLGADHDRLVKVLQPERLRMGVAVFRLGEVLAEEAVRQVAADAGGGGGVGRLLPGLVLRLPYVAVRAHPRGRAHAPTP